MNTLTWCALAGLLITGCAPALRVSTAGRETTVAEIHARARVNNERVRTLRGSGSISFESPEMAGSGSFDIILQKPDSVLLHLEGPFGITLGSALITRTRFFFYNSVENQLISGSSSPSNLRRYLRMNVTFDDLLTLFAGSAFLAEDDVASGELTSKDDSFILTYRHDGRVRQYSIDPETLLITTVHHFDAAGRLVAEQSYSNYRRTQDVSFATSIRLILNSERRLVSIRYSDVSLNQPVGSLTLDVPANARTVEVR